MTTATLAPERAATRLRPADLLEPVEQALAAFLAQPTDTEARAELARWHRAAVEAVAELPPAQKNGRDVEAVWSLLAELSQPLACPTEEDVLKADALALRGWPGLLAAMLLVPANHWPDAPRFEEVPTWLWGRYAEWLFAAPAGAELAPAVCRRRMEELAQLVETSLGSASVRAVAEVYLRAAALPAGPVSAADWRALADLRGRILTRLLTRGVAPYDPVYFPAQNRRLKIGIIRRSFAASADTYATLARFEHLDARNFEVVLFSLSAEHAPLADYCGRRASALQVLPAGREAQVAAVRAAAPDVLVWADTLTDLADDFVQLATRRLAPLQAAFNRQARSPGLPEIDCLIGDAQVAAVAGRERFARLAGSMPVYAFPRVAAAEDEAAYDRESLGIPPGAPVFMALTRVAALTQTAVDAWARVVAAVPTAKFFLHLTADRLTVPGVTEQWSARISEVMARQGVGPERVTVYAPDVFSHTDARALLRVGGLYLAPWDDDETVWVAEALAMGMPAVVGSATPAAALVTAAGTPQLAAADIEAWVRTAAAIGRDEVARAELSQQILTRVEAGVEFLDTLGAADAFGGLVHAAWAELGREGRKAFGANRGPLGCALEGTVEAVLADAAAAHALGDFEKVTAHAAAVLAVEPFNARARVWHGRGLLAQNHPARAVDYLLAAIQQLPPDAGLWLELATALERNGQRAEAIQALESSLRLDERNVDGWLMLIDLAEAGGATDLRDEATEIARKLAPHHPRLATVC